MISKLTTARAFKLVIGTWFWWRVSLTLKAVRGQKRLTVVTVKIIREQKRLTVH
jgi:hypothetical protein